MATRSSSSEKKQKRKTIVFNTDPFRMAFPALFEPEEDDNGTEKYKLAMLFPPDSPSIDKIMDAMDDVMEDAFGPEADWPSGKKDILPEDKFFDAGKKTYQGYKKGWMVLSASSTEPPGIIDANKNDVLSKREVYGGRWARAQIAITTFDNKAKGVTAYLNHVQLLDNDEAFNGKGSATDAFDKYELKDRGRSRDRDEDAEENDSRGSRRTRSRDDRNSDDDDRGGRFRRSRDDDREDEKDTRSGRGRSRSRDAEDEDEKPRTRSRGRDDDDADEKPRSRSRGEDEEDERGSRRSRPRDEDEDERGSRSRSRSRDDDDGERKPSGNRGRASRKDDDDEWN